MRTCFLCSFLSCCLLLTTAQGLEIEGEQAPAYLERTLQADWRLTPVSEVLTEIQRLIDRPLLRSPALRDEAEDQGRVILVDVERNTLGGVLELLEASQDLRFTAEALRLRVETLADHRDRRRRVVNLQLRDYGLSFQPSDFPGNQLGLHDSDTGSGGFALFGAEDVGRVVDSGGISPDDLLEIMHSVLDDDAQISVKGTGSVYTRATPEEEAALRTLLEQHFHQRSRHSAWQVQFGLLPADEALAATGLVDAEQAAAVAGQLRQRRLLVASAFTGQQVAANDLVQRAYLADLEVSAENLLDPVVQVLNTGRALELRPLLGFAFNRLSGSLSWVEERDWKQQRIQGRRTEPSTTLDLDLDGKLKRQPDQKEDTLDMNGSGSLDSEPGKSQPESMDLEQPTIWTWTPKINLFIPHGKVLLLNTPHPDGMAVMILEELQP